MMNHLPRERKKSRLLAFPEPGFIVQKIAKDAAPAVTAPPVTIWKPEVGSAVNSQRLDNRFIFIAFLVGMATMSLPHLPLLALSRKTIHESKDKAGIKKGGILGELNHPRHTL